jgi:hypothetical protein
MNVPIRMIGIATSLFWVFLIAFAASTAYSIKDLRFDFGEPQFAVTPMQELVFSLPIYIENRGYYSIGDFSVTTQFSGPDGSILTRDTTLIPIIPRGQSETILHNVTLDLNQLLENNEQYLFNDNELRVAASVGLKLSEVLPVQVATNFSFPWGAPLCNFMLGEPTIEGFNSSHQRVTVPVSFENHAPFDLAGNLQLKIFNDANMLLGENQKFFEVPQHSPYNDYFEFYIDAAQMTPAGSFEVSFLTSFFDYGPMVIPYG